MQEKRTESPMTKVARFIVDKRKAFYLVFIAAFVFCAASINKVQVNNDITSYLPAQTETPGASPSWTRNSSPWAAPT